MVFHPRRILVFGVESDGPGSRIPRTPSELLADCFALAVEVRELDMRASPYDLTALGYPPVRLETAAGRAEYARAQAGFAARAAPLRDRLVEICTALIEDPIDVSGAHETAPHL